MGKSKPAPPAGLATGGKTVWANIIAHYEFRPDELVTLEDACRITDMIDALDVAWAEDDRPMTAKGSTGQLIIHPLIGEMRTQRMARNALWRQLKLPDVDGETPAVNQNRSAGNSRWAAAHGKGS